MNTMSKRTPNKYASLFLYSFSRSKRQQNSSPEVSLKAHEPFNAYYLFCNEQRELFEERNLPSPTIAELSNMWTCLSSEMKDKYLKKFADYQAKKARSKQIVNITPIRKRKMSAVSSEKMKEERGPNLYANNEEINEIIRQSCMKRAKTVKKLKKIKLTTEEGKKKEEKRGRSKTSPGPAPAAVPRGPQCRRRRLPCGSRIQTEWAAAPPWPA